MQPFDLHIHTRFLFGGSKADAFADAVANVGNSIHIITGGGSVVKSGYYSQIKSLLEKRGVKVYHFSGIEPNPQAKTCDRAAQEVSKSGADAVLALGGGSVMDATKAIAALVHDNEPHIWPFVLGEPRKGELKGALPIICVPTTAATASEVTIGAIISNAETNGKASIAYPFLRPCISWLNPEFTVGVPPITTADGASDIFSHVIENYLLGGTNSPVTDYYCEGIIKTVIDTLPKVIADPTNLQYRADLLWASNLALNGYHSAGRNPSAYVLHALEHALSGYNTDLAHGRGLAILYPAYFRWLWDNNHARERFSRLGKNIFAHEGDDDSAGMGFITDFESWLRENGLFQSIPSIGIPVEAYKEIATYAVRVYGRNNVIPAVGGISADDIIDIFQRTHNQV